MADPVRVIAQYFPQFHAIPENDRWWGQGFTDWVNVRRAAPLFPGHAQPRIPLHGRYYDQSDPQVIRWQIDLARDHGVDAFCHYHYWFDGKQLLERPTNQFLEMRDLRFSFCLAWANETWSRRWDGQDHHILQLQTHTPSKERWEAHFRYLIRAFTDERALRVDGRPVFLIYRPHRIAELRQLLDYWQERARQHGLDGIFFVAMVQHHFPEWEVMRHFDALMLFQPFVCMYTQANPPTPLWDRVSGRVRPLLPSRLDTALHRRLEAYREPTLIDYDEVWRRIVERPVDRAMPVFPGAFVDWDNTPRYGRRAKIFRGASPARFEHWMSRLLAEVKRYPPTSRLVFINAWNEWAEGAHLEPDERHGRGYLEALRRAVDANRDRADSAA